MRYYSKKNIWLMAIIWFVLLLPLGLGILFLIKVGPGGIWGTIFLGIVVDVPVLLLTYPIYYEITPTTLLIRSGLIRMRIPLTSIQQVFPDSTWGSPGGVSFAMSLDRLRINSSYREWPSFVYIAPKDKVKFMQDLVEQTEGLEFKDGQVIRRQ
jgi:Bacterial PH domain